MIEEKDVLSLVHFKAQFDTDKGTVFLRSKDPLFNSLIKNGSVPTAELIQKSKIIDNESDLFNLKLDVNIDHILEPIGNLCYSKALVMVKKGFRITRASWNGKDQWVKMIVPYAPHPDTFTEDFNPRINNPYFKPADNNVFAEGTMISWLGIKTTQNFFVPWTASQTDTLAEDWIVLP